MKFQEHLLCGMQASQGKTSAETDINRAEKTGCFALILYGPLKQSFEREDLGQFRQFSVPRFLLSFSQLIIYVGNFLEMLIIVRLDQKLSYAT